MRCSPTFYLLRVIRTKEEFTLNLYIRPKALWQPNPLDLFHESLVTQKPLIPDIIVIRLMPCSFPLRHKFQIPQPHFAHRFRELSQNRSGFDPQIVEILAPKVWRKCSLYSSPLLRKPIGGQVLFLASSVIRQPADRSVVEVEKVCNLSLTISITIDRLDNPRVPLALGEPPFKQSLQFRPAQVPLASRNLCNLLVALDVASLPSLQLRDASL